MFWTVKLTHIHSIWIQRLELFICLFVCLFSILHIHCMHTSTHKNTVNKLQIYLKNAYSIVFSSYLFIPNNSFSIQTNTLIDASYVYVLYVYISVCFLFVFAMLRFRSLVIVLFLFCSYTDSSTSLDSRVCVL